MSDRFSGSNPNRYLRFFLQIVIRIFDDLADFPHIIIQSANHEIPAKVMKF